MSGLLRSPLHRVRLIRLLQPLLPEPGPAAVGDDVAERLSQWLGAFDAVKLDSALGAIETYAPTTRSIGRPVQVDKLLALVQRLHDELLAHASPRAPVATATPRSRLADPSVNPDAVTPASVDEGFGPWLQRGQELQKQMEARVAVCRGQLRQALAQGGPRLRRLAALDAVMEQTFGAREARLMASVPLLLERRFEQHRLEGRGPQAFEPDFREWVLAELQTRLQPLYGLIEAARCDPAASVAVSDPDLPPHAA